MHAVILHIINSLASGIFPPFYPKYSKTLYIKCNYSTYPRHYASGIPYPQMTLRLKPRSFAEGFNIRRLALLTWRKKIGEASILQIPVIRPGLDF